LSAVQFRIQRSCAALARCVFLEGRGQMGCALLVFYGRSAANISSRANGAWANRVGTTLTGAQDRVLVPDLVVHADPSDVAAIMCHRLNVDINVTKPTGFKHAEF
jgi:hypothetical protein